MSEIDTYYFHGAQRDLDMRKSTGGDWVKRTDHETAMRDLTKVADDLTKRVDELADEGAPPQSNFIVATIAAEALIAKLELEKKMLRAGDCPECEAMVRAADDEEILSGVVALANGAVVKLRFPEAELERFVDMATNGDYLLRAIVPPDGWTCELLVSGFAPPPATQLTPYGPHYVAPKPTIRVCELCGDSGPLDIMRCKCVGEAGE